MNWTLAIIVVFGTASAAPIGLDSAPPMTLLDALQVWSGETRPDIHVWDPFGKRPVAVLSWGEFAAFVQQTPLDLPGPVPAESPGCSPLENGDDLPVYCGPDAGRGLPPEHIDWRCFTGAAWVAYEVSETVPHGSAFTEMVPGDDPAPDCASCWNRCVVQDWDFVEMSSTKNPDVLAGLYADGCFASEWTIHPDGYCPNSAAYGSGPPLGRGLPDTFALHWRAEGPGAAVVFKVGGSGVWMDVFLGIAPVTCYDIPDESAFFDDCPRPPE